MLGALIGAGSSLLGGLMAGRQADKQAKLQKQFAQNAIQWKAADAEKAGISKLYALGANTVSYSPVSTGGSLSEGISSAGQNIGRAIDAQNSNLGRTGQLATAIAKTQLEGLQVDNDIKRAHLASQITTNNQAGNPPGAQDITTTPHIPGQGNSTILLKKEIAPASPGQANRSYGVSPDVDMYKTTHGYAPEVPSELGEAQESQPFSAAQWFIRNKIAPLYDESRQTPPYKAPPGMKWAYNPLYGEYKLVKRKDYDWSGGLYR